MMRWAYILIRAVDLKYEILSTPSRRATAGGGMRLRSAAPAAALLRLPSGSLADAPLRP